VLFGVAAVASIIVLSVVDDTTIKAIAGLLLMLCVFVCIFEGEGRKRRAKSLLGPNCSGPYFARYVRVPNATEHWFSFASREFAQRFAELNGGKVMAQESIAGHLGSLARRLRLQYHA